MCSDFTISGFFCKQVLQSAKSFLSAAVTVKVNRLKKKVKKVNLISLKIKKVSLKNLNV